jgi:hypothetical protein
MKLSLFIKLNFLVLGLGLTLYFIYYNKNNGLPPAVLEFFGIAPSNQNIYKETLCDTRVESLIRPEKFKITQKGDEWVRDNGDSILLNFISVEKWFGRNCAVRAERVNENISLEQKSEFLPALFVKFITGEVEYLRRSPDGRYIWRNRVFKSSKLDQALGELDELGGAKAQKE